MVSFSCRLFFSIALLVLLAVPAAGAQKTVKNRKVVSLRSTHKFVPAQSKATKKHKKRAKRVEFVVPEDLKSEWAAEESNAALAEVHVKLTCRSAYIMDANTGKDLYNLGADRPGQPASTIKIITGLIAVESLNDTELIRASAYAANMPASKIYLKKGMFYRANDLINAVLLASANDASVALAERVAGSESAFARLMTKKAESLGAQNTICKSANGLTRPGQQTTARDLATVFNQAMHNPEFAERMSTVQVHTSDGKLLRSHNKALWTLDGAVGGKTGYTAAAGKTYVGKFQRNGQAIIVALLGSASMWSDVATLVEHGFVKQEMASRLPDDGFGVVRLSQASQKKLVKKGHVQYATLTLTGQKKKSHL